MFKIENIAITNLQKQIDNLKNEQPILSKNIKYLSDFPTPISGVITLKSNTEYVLEQIIDISPNRIVSSSNNTISGKNNRVGGLTTTNTGIMITSTDNYIELSNIKLTSTFGIAIDFSNSESCTVNNCYFFSNNKIGIVSGGRFVRFDTNTFEDNSDGITFIGSGSGTHIYYTNNISHGNIAGTDITIPANGTFTVINITGNHFHPGPPSLTALDISNIYTLLSAGFLINNSFLGGGTYLTGGLDNTAVEWQFIGNNNIKDSKVFGEMCFGDNPTPFRIDFNNLIGTNDYLPCAATGPSWQMNTSERVIFSEITNDEGSNVFPSGTSAPNGRLTYNGRENIECTITWRGTAEVQSGGNRTFNFLIGKGNVNITDITMFADSTTNPGTDTTVTTGVHGLSIGDKIFIRHTTDYNGTLTIQAVPTPTTFDIDRTYISDDATGDWVAAVFPSISQLSLENNEQRLFVSSFVDNCITGDFYEPLIETLEAGGTPANFRVNISHTSFVINGI